MKTQLVLLKWHWYLLTNVKKANAYDITLIERGIILPQTPELWESIHRNRVRHFDAGLFHWQMFLFFDSLGLRALYLWMYPPMIEPEKN